VKAQIKYYLKNKHLCVSIIAHTDSDGNDQSNMELSQRRAQVIADMMIEGGIEPWRIIEIVGKGESEPVCREETDECKARNRRVEFISSEC
jgi:OOP family OmpA-OmpF porin